MRVFLLHHVTWSVNSVCHFFGRRRFDTDDTLDQRLLARPAVARRGLAPQPPRLPALGQHGLRWWEIDVSGLVIRGCERVGLAWNVVDHARAPGQKLAEGPTQRVRQAA